MCTKQNNKLRTKVHSLNSRILILIILPLIMLSPFLFVYNAHAVSIVRNNTFEVNAQSLDVYMDSIDESMKNVEKYWAGLEMSSDLLTFIITDKQIDYYKALYRLRTDMASVVQSYKFIDCLFVYEEDKDEYFDAAKYDLSTEERNEIKALVISEIKHGNRLAGKWYPVEINGNYYLIRFFKMLDTYVGSLVSVSRLLSTMRESGFTDFEYLTFYGFDGKELGNVLPLADRPLGIDGTFQRFETQIGNVRYLVISRPSEYGNFSAVAVTSDASVVGGLQSFQIIIAIWGFGIIVFLIIFTIMIRRWVLLPMNGLCDAMNSLKSGNLDVKLSMGNDSCTEFMLVKETFDNMSESIKTLKIDVYEQNMQRQAAEIREKNTELQYMKEQIRPHFYINCLNVINNLSIMNKNSQVCEMTAYLSNQMRYILSSKTVDTLKRELDFVENYLQIQEICYGDGLCTHIEVDPSVLMVCVPPLIIMTFISNISKHQVVVGERIDAYVLCAKCEESGNNRIKIEIWDSGEGYPQHILESIQAGERIIDERGEHFGIRNIITRLHLIYGGRERITINNHWETGGAHIIIELPDNGGNCLMRNMEIKT